MSTPDMSRDGSWRQLFPPALTLMRHLGTVMSRPGWSFGGGTVLMLRIGHRQSKDIDLFVPDPQYLGYLTPRLGDIGESVSTEYSEAAEYLKFYLPEGEIDVVVGLPLTPESIRTRGPGRHARPA
jgi:Nucleotidyl transferase AbiEii toxin, Type IV TA system